MLLNTQNTKIIDLYGRERIYNGINIVFKGQDDPSVPGGRRYTRDFSPEDFKGLRKKGINLVRLGIVWDAIEHEMGTYDSAYLDWVEGILDMCRDNEIEVFLDMHQDLYSRIFDGGAPEWATLTDDAPHIKGDLWSDAYLFSEAVNKAFKNFWQNAKTKAGIGLLDHYQKLWQHVIMRLSGHEAIIGYDFINEPFPGENSLEIMGSLLMTYSLLTGQNKSPEEMMAAFQDETMKFQLLQDIDDTELFTAMAAQGQPLVNAFDQGPLKDFYNRMTASLRELTDHGLVLTENCYFSNMGIESGLQPVMVDGQKEPLQVYSPHGYDLVVDTPAVVMASNNRIRTILDAHLRVQSRLDIPVIFGEWGAHGGYKEGLSHIEFILNYFDQHKWSHTYYCWEDGMTDLPVMDKLSRPYPQATSGELIDYSYDFQAKTFHMLWTEKEIMALPTVIYLPNKPVNISGCQDYSLVAFDDGSYHLQLPSNGQGKRQLSIQL